MKRAKLILTALMSVLFFLSLNAQHYTVQYTNQSGDDYRLERKIKKGIRSGELSKKEVRKLKHELDKIEHLKRKAWRNGHLSRKERKRINHALNDFDRLFYKYMNNRKFRHRSHDRNYDRYDRWEDDYDTNYDYYYGNKGKKGKRRH